MSRSVTPRHGRSRRRRRQTPLLITLAVVLLFTASAPTRDVAKYFPQTPSGGVADAYRSHQDKLPGKTGTAAAGAASVSDGPIAPDPSARAR